MLSKNVALTPKLLVLYYIELKLKTCMFVENKITYICNKRDAYNVVRDHE